MNPADALLPIAQAANERAFDFWSTLLVLATIIVGFGLVVEYVPDFSEHIENSKWKKWFVVPGALLVTLGVVGEGFVEYKVLRTEGALREIVHDEDSVNALKVAKAHLETLKLAKEVKWRRLDDVQVAFIEIPLSRFAGQRIDVLTYFGDLEAEMFASQIVKALTGERGAGWKVTGGTIRYSPSIFSGVVVDTLPGASERDRQIAKYLIDTLQYWGVGVFVLPPEWSGKGLKGQILAGHLDPKAFITLTVGVHPEPLPPPPPKPEQQ